MLILTCIVWDGFHATAVEMKISSGLLQKNFC